MTPACIIQDVGFRYGDNWALRNASFELECGTFCALLGPNGAGKSTLFSLLTHLNRPHEGVIAVQGCDLEKGPRRALAQLGIVFQQPTLDLETTVQNNMAYFAGLHGLHGAEARRRIDAALDRMDMRERAGEMVRALNGGHRRRMEIARTLIHDPAILLLDEPTVGLDPQARQSITDHTHALAQDGLAVLWATHLVDEIRPRDQVVVLDQGQVRAQGKFEDVSKDQAVSVLFPQICASGGHST